MNYIYYPGCSLKGTGRAYEESFLAIAGALGLAIEELNDWNCCGATTYMGIDEKKAFAMAARNLALSEEQAPDDKPVNFLALCSACYLVHLKAQTMMDENPNLKATIIGALANAQLSYQGRVKIRHPLDVLVNDAGIDKIKSLVVKPLKGLKVACHYGCLVVRPYATFDDQNNPTSMDRLIQALGAETIEWPLKTRCCGGTLMGTIPDVGSRLNYILLKEAKRRGADVVATACPLCQFNLECFQNQISSLYGEPIHLPVAYFSQLMGISYGISNRQLGMQRLFVPLQPSLAV